MELKENQSALLLEIDEQGEVEVHVASGDDNGLTAKICRAIAEKLMSDGGFREEILSALEGD